LLTGDGEKPDRNREGEFDEKVVPRDQLMASWEALVRRFRRSSIPSAWRS